MSAGREFQVDGAATEKARRASSVCMRGTTSIGRAHSPRQCTGLYQLAEIRWSGCGPHLRLLRLNAVCENANNSHHSNLTP